MWHRPVRWALLLVVMVTPVAWAGAEPPVVLAQLPPSLQSALAADGAAQMATMPAAALQDFFRRYAGNLDLFCTTATCRPRAQKQGLLQRYFRGSYAQLPTAPESEADLAQVYAFHAARYFSEKDYACRRPLTAAVLAAVWQLPDPARCEQPLPFLVAQEGREPVLQWVDPQRVYALHLLFAGSTGVGISRFGHVMLRVLQCNPQRATVDAACEQDLFDHVALGFRAGVDDLDLSIWKGMTGGYPVKLYANAFMDSYRQYTIDEFRPVYSLPLRLSPEASLLLLQGLAEAHWSYQDGYRFFTRNCASELQWLLEVVAAVATPGSPWLPQQRYRPDKLFADAREAPAFAGELLQDVQRAETGGYYFPSAEPYFQTALQALRDGYDAAGKKLPATPEQWRKLKAAERYDDFLAPLLQRSALASGNDAVAGSARHGLQGAVVLESWIERRLRRQILAGMARYYSTLARELEQRDAFFSASEKALMQSCMATLREGEQAGQETAGVPLQGYAVTPAGCDLRSPALLALMRRFFEAFPVSAASRADIAELEATIQNINKLAQALRA